PAYEDFIAQQVQQMGIAPAYGYMPRGHALIWHANLLHGGSRQKDSSRSRHSQVTHYFFEDCRYYTPMHSTPDMLAFRNPEWIDPDTWEERKPPVDTDALQKMSPLARKIAALRDRLRW